jgi:hypothetical protein
VLDQATPAFAAYYDAAKLWPARSLQRYAEAKALSQATAAKTRRPSRGVT